MTVEGGSAAARLDLDPDRVARLARFRQEHADYRFEANINAYGEFGALQLRASGYVVAASYFALVSADTARGVFEKAADMLTDAHNAFALVAAACGGMKAPFFELQASDASTLSPALVGAAWAAARDEDLEQARSLGEASEDAPESMRPIGRLRVPARVQRGVVRAVARTVSDRGESDLPHALATYLERAAETVGAAASDSYHWRNLYSALLPVEPEALGLSAAASVAWRRATGRSLVEDLPLRGWPAVALEVGAALAGEETAALA